MGLLKRAKIKIVAKVTIVTRITRVSWNVFFFLRFAILFKVTSVTKVTIIINILFIRPS